MRAKESKRTSKKSNRRRGDGRDAMVHVHDPSLRVRYVPEKRRDEELPPPNRPRA